LDCEQNNIELVTVAVELRVLCLWVPSTLIGLAMPPSSGTFNVVEDVKAMQIDADDPAKTIQIRVGLNFK
jgi:hypothetical protein